MFRRSIILSRFEISSANIKMSSAFLMLFTDLPLITMPNKVSSEYKLNNSYLYRINCRWLESLVSSYGILSFLKLWLELANLQFPQAVFIQFVPMLTFAHLARPYCPGHPSYEISKFFNTFCETRNIMASPFLKLKVW